MEATAHCGRCDFNFTSHVCTVIRGSHTSIGKASVEEMCSSAEEPVHMGSVNTLSFAGNRKGATCPRLRRGSEKLLKTQIYFTLTSTASFTSYQLIPSYLRARELPGGSRHNLDLVKVRSLKFFRVEL